MSTRPSLRRAPRILLAVAIIPVLAACSGGAGSNPATSAPGGNTAPASVPAVAGGTDVCSSIPQADVQALLAFPITHVADNSAFFSCGYKFSGGTTSFSFDWNAADADLSSYNTLQGNADHEISGFGDKAFWNEAVPDHTPPSLIAHKGNATCTIMANDPPDITMKTTPMTGIYAFSVTDADALAYVQLMGKVCNDVFAGLGG